MQLIIAAALLASVMGGGDPDQRSAIPVEVWTSCAHSGVCGRFGGALEAAFEASPAFSQKGGVKARTLIVSIADEPAYAERSGRFRVSYRIRFEDVAHKRIGASKGSCWDDEMEKCAAQVLKDAERPAQKLLRR
jgi:hypothetical protein